MKIQQRPLAVCITGPTATGKTDAAVSVCLALDGQVISMDSMQLYRGFTVGTAKPSVREMAGVPHHMISRIPPEASYSVAEYQRDAREVMEGLLAQGLLPVFCGGTGLYLQAVSRPLSFTEASGGGEIRQELQRQAQEPDGPRKLHAHLAVVDPDSAVRLHVNNTRRVVRALEVYLTTGEPMSSQGGEWNAEPDEEWLIFALNWPREQLYDRIGQRVDRMIAQGLIDEVRLLLSRGVPESAQAMQAIGYKEILAYLNGQCSQEDAIETIKINTRHYAKRQLTWLKRDERVQWIDASAYRTQMALHNHIIDRVRNHEEAMRHG